MNFKKNSVFFYTLTLNYLFMIHQSKKLILFSAFFLCALFGISQITVTIGNGSITNNAYTYPAPYGNWYWGAKQQYLILASELNASGMVAGNITDIQFNVATPAGTLLDDLTFALKNTSSNSLTNFETGLTTVYGPQGFTEVSGWNNHNLFTPFYWDGVSNLLIETCFNNTSYTTNAQVYQSNTSFSSSVVYFSDALNNCLQTSSSQNFNQRPNLKITFQPNNVPPITSFNSNTTSSCNSTFNFFDLSANFPTSWLWDFGDGNTSVLQNPSHSYALGGTYTVSLITYNAFGSDTLIMVNYITYNPSVPLPVSSSCTPVTQNGSLGFGITNFSFNTINNTSADASAGYEDFTCIQTTLMAGQNYAVSYVHAVPTTHNSAVWIDYNNNGVFENSSELVFSANNATNPSGNIFIPANSVQNTPLRLRVWADYDFSSLPSSCGNPDYGQAEDYAVIIIPNGLPPEAHFSFTDNNSCSGLVCFNDESLNVPNAWHWDFGDGNTSVLQYPCHTYTFDGTYDVTLIVTNANGADTIEFLNAVTINTAGAVLTPSCSPGTLGYCCGYGIYKVDFNTISYASNDGAEGYMDFSCDQQTNLTEGLFYNLEVRTGINNPQDTRVWIDFNNDGIFDPAELIMDAPNDFNPTSSVFIPTGMILNTPLRMRVSSDVVGTAQLGCTNNDFGQTEDYGVIILPNNDPPVAAFSASPSYTCNVPVQFSDNSLNGVTSWFWDFGDGNTSFIQNPVNVYTSEGIYSVTLIVTNANGSDTLEMNNYVTINCDTILMPVSGTQSYTMCSGTVYDDGGPDDNYSDNMNGILVIEPAGATSVVISFSYFNFTGSTAGDTIYFYDGNTTSAPLMGAFSGNNLPPNMNSTGGAVTVQMITGPTANDPGFIFSWNCILGENELERNDLSVYPNPTSDKINIVSSKPGFINLYDQTGRVVFTEQKASMQFSINISDFADGIYFVEWYDGLNRKINKVIIQK